MASPMDSTTTAFPSKYVHLWTSLSNYVETQCKNLEREESHGFSHMQRVASNGVALITHKDNAGFLSDLSEEELDLAWKLLLAATWLHDLEDHKFVIDEQVKEKLHGDTVALLSEMFGSEFSVWVFDIIERGSHSKQNENRNIPEWFGALTPLCQKVCHLLRDADRLDAIGELGMWRHLEYTSKTYQTNHSGAMMPYREMVDVAKDFVPKVLMKLVDTHFMTPVGISMAKDFTRKLGGELNKLTSMTFEEICEAYPHLPIC